MRNELLQLIKEKESIYTTEITDLLPIAKGEGAMFLPTREGYNKNILILANVNVDFIRAYNELIKANLIELEDIGIHEYVLSGTPIYSNLQVATKKNLKTQKNVWLPTVIKLVKND